MEQVTVRQHEGDNIGPLVPLLVEVHAKRFREQFELDGESLVRPPRGYDPAHELIEDIKRKDFVATRHFSDAEAMSAQLPKIVIDGCKGIAPMIDYLCAALDLEF